MSSATLELAKQLITCPSITPSDAGCQTIMAARLAAMGFKIEQLPFKEVTNFWARRGHTGPLLVFAGHTDVVPTGPLADWSTPPFTPTVKDGYLYGRGAADMKAALAAMITACESFIATYPHHSGSIGFLITSDEEGPGIHGTAKVVDYLQARQEKMDWCVVGEPSSERQLGDTIKQGRRGSLTGKLTFIGKQGHVAYPQLAINPIHKALPALAELASCRWDEGTSDFPATSLQITDIHAGTGASNVIPGQLEVVFNFRYCPAVTAESLMQQVEVTLNNHQLEYHLQWHHSAQPFITSSGSLLTACQAAIQTVLGISPVLSTGGGTSDARFIAPTGCQVVELGHCNRSIHQVDECVAVADIDRLAAIYYQILANLLLS